jgi:serine/threonine protein kinase
MGIFGGLAHLHKWGIYHGDVKPSNILFDDKMTVKLADVGASALISSSTQQSIDISVRDSRFLGALYTFLTNAAIAFIAVF